MSFRYFKTFIALVILFLGSCGQPDTTITKGISDASVLKAAILQALPIGSEIKKAQEFMEHNGFACHSETNASFGSQKGIDYLYCDKRVTTKWPVVRRWQVAVVQKEDKVTDVLISTGLVGP